MDEENIERCKLRIAQEREQAEKAPDEITAELHVQKARLYETQLAVLEGGWSRSARA